MFDPSDKPRVFTVPLGLDFPKALVAGLRTRSSALRPEVAARVQVIVNTRRMARRMRVLFDEGPPCLLPRISLITDPGETWSLGALPSAVSPLRRRLELVQLVSAFLDAEPDLAPRSSIYGLADSLANFMDEMHGENVPLSQIEALDLSDQSGHWSRIKSFLGIIRHYFEDDAAPDVVTRQRLVVEARIAAWQAHPPEHPILLAGSTGSRGTTRLLMEAVAKLPNGAVILPGFDDEMELEHWDVLTNSAPFQDHPQYRFAAFLSALNLTAEDTKPWAEIKPACPPRNKLLSLALRPAPVTDQWMRDGPKLGDLSAATKGLTLIEAPTTRIEAQAIAMRLREAAEEGRTAALITPDRTLTRQVAAALDRWGIVPDDSAGQPLHLSPVGRFLRHVGDLLYRPLSAESLLTLLKHPLTHSGDARGPHLRLTRELELHLRRHGPPFPEPSDLCFWLEGQKDPFAADWVAWLIDHFCANAVAEEADLPDLVTRHLSMAEAIAKGSGTADSGRLWQEEAGRAATKIVSNLAENAKFGGRMRASDYTSLFHSLLAAEQVRNVVEPHPNVLIWGTLEARVQGADLLILAGLNEGNWPEMPGADPWLNRALRQQLGLLLPERQIGLAAHDFQQAATAEEVWLTRSVRSSDAETVPSRWLNRVQNLISGLPLQGGEQALKDMRKRGQYRLAMVAALEAFEQQEPARRPSPMPPVESRPKKLSVTQIKTLIRDPYAIYARHVLRLRPLDPLMQLPSALMRGILAHKALEEFIWQTKDDPDLVTRDKMMGHIRETLDENVPWAEARALWYAKLDRIADWFVENEHGRRVGATPAMVEARGNAMIKSLGFTLTAEADRIDMGTDGRLRIYDYKTGAPPNENEQKFFDKQLLLEAAIATQEGFADMGPRPVDSAVFIGLGSDGKEQPAPLDTEPPEKVWAELETLIGRYLSPDLGFTARRAMQKVDTPSDYDQLSRYGEWDTTDTPNPLKVE